jgi:hypothetical protein
MRARLLAASATAAGLSCRMAPNSAVGRTGKHPCRTASAASRYLADMSLGTTLVAVIMGGPRSSPNELIMKRSTVDDPTVPPGTNQQVAK